VSSYRKDKVFNVTAEVIEVLDELGWYYHACPTHKTRIRSTKPYYYCPLCTTKVEQPQPWLNFTLLVKDSTCTTNFTFTGKQAEQLLGSSAQQLLTEQSPTPTEKQVLPQEFEELKTKKYTFTVHWDRSKFRPNFISYQVITVTPIAPTTQTSPPRATPPELPTTPPKQRQKISSQEQSKLAPTTEKKTARRELFIQEPSKKPRTR
jgi:hypothetical protein